MSNGDAQSPSLKRQRPSERQPDEFSNTVRRRLEKSSRTGQACDRCKVRKIRCDATPGGCTPCRQNNTECKTIDRITGKATIRGHQDRVEDENRLLRQKCEEYSSQLKELGIDVPPIQFPPLYAPQPPSSWAASATPWADPLHNGPQSLPAYNATAAAISQALPTFRDGAPGDNYVGIGSQNGFLSTITGTSLQIFGMKIDVADYAPSATDDISSAASYEFFLAAITHRLPESSEEVHLPNTLEDMNQYADWYFKTLSPYTPAVIRPEVMDVIHKTYSDASYTPTAAQRVWMHMVLAYLKYQFGHRNSLKASLDEAHAHFRYSLGFYYEMSKSHTLQDIQAMALICVHMRNFTKPGAAWITTSRTLDMALELGLHRSAKAWGEENRLEPAEIETRKRVFWTLHGLLVHLSGKLGRPMPLRLDDVDIEYPDPVSDAMPGEPEKCSFLVGIQVHKITSILSQMYSSVYTVRRDPALHEATVKRLEEMLDTWRSELPPELADVSRCEGEHKVYALYVQFFDAEVQLLLHHPAVCLSSNPSFIEWNSNICLMAATNMLRVVEQLKAFKSLDLPWINLTVYLAAVFITLFVQSQRQEPMNLLEMEKLRRDMAVWLDIMGELGRILGSGNRLQESIRTIIDQALGTIAQRLNIQKPQSVANQVDPTAAAVAAAIATEANRVSQEQAAAASSGQDNMASSMFTTYADANAAADVKPRPSSTYLPPEEAARSASFSTNPPSSYNYPDPSVASVPSYGGANSSAASVAASANAFAAEQGYVPASTEQQGNPQATPVPMTTATMQQPPADYNLYAAGPSPHTPHPIQQQNPQVAAAAANAVMYNIGAAVGGVPQPQNDWMRWSSQAAVGPPIQGNGQEYLSGANTLMTLRGNEGTTGPPAAGVAASGIDNGQTPLQGQWPAMLFTTASNAIAPQPDGAGN